MVHWAQIRQAKYERQRGFLELAITYPTSIHTGTRQLFQVEHGGTLYCKWVIKYNIM